MLIRLSTIFWKCREEQQWCTQHLYSNIQNFKFGSTSGKADYLVSMVVIAVFVTLNRNSLRSSGNLVGFSPSILVMRYAPIVMVVSVGCYWVMHKLPKDTKNRFMSGWHINYFPWIVYTFCLVGIASIVIKPLFVYILPKQKDDMGISSDDDVIPHVFKHVKGLFNQKSKSSGDDGKNVPIIYGVNAVYSAAFISSSVYICLLLGLLLGDVLAPSVVLLYFSAVVILVITALSKCEKMTNIGKFHKISTYLEN